MQRSPSLRQRWRKVVVSGLALTVAAVAAPVLGGQPAGAAPAPLATTDGLGIRIDETAILGPAIEAIETAMQPTVNQMIRDGAVASAPVSGYHALYVSSNLELSADFVNAGTTGYPSGGIKVHADIEDIEIQYRRNAWWHSDCGIWVRPSDATIDASAKIDKTRLPATPLALNPITAWWDDDPDVSSSGMCWTYLIDDWFNNLFNIGGSESVASRIERDLNSRAQELFDDLWADHVDPVLDSLSGFGITVNQLRTDDHGLIVTADVDASGGITIPGMGGPYNVTNAQDSGASSDVNTLLASRTVGGQNSEVIVSIHPNVVNQFMYALNTFQNNAMGTNAVDPSIENVLLNAGDRAAYADNGWTVRLRVSALAQAPFTQPVAPGQKPVLGLPSITMQFYNSSFSPILPVASFSGSMAGIDLVTETRTGSTEWGPGFSTANATLPTLNRTQANPAAAAVPAQAPGDLLPFAKRAFDLFNQQIFVQYVSLAPLSIGGLNVSLCSTCGRYAGDERYTETFLIG